VSTALVLVHLDSLGPFNAETGMGWELAGDLAEAAHDHVGPVIGIVQGWRERLARPVVETIENRADGHLVEFDEDVSDWEDFLPNLLSLLHSVGATSAVVGGLWFEPGGQYGCVNETAAFLGQHMPTTIDETIVGTMEE
jgi:hypothetical protein